MTSHFKINHSILIQMHKKGNVTCVVCQKPIVEGQLVAWTRNRLKHEDA